MRVEWTGALQPTLVANDKKKRDEAKRIRDAALATAARRRERRRRETRAREKRNANWVADQMCRAATAVGQACRTAADRFQQLGALTLPAPR